MVDARGEDKMQMALAVVYITWMPSSKPIAVMPLRKLDEGFFHRPAIQLAPALIGTILVRQIRKRLYRARIVETEAYVGAHDLACHAAKGRTARTEVMFGPGGHAYVYFIYGMHHMLNIVASVPDDPQAVLIRGAIPLDDWHVDLSGPGKLARHFQITRALNGIKVTGSQLFLQSDGYEPKIVTTKRIGIDYAQEWKDELLRFVDANHVRLRSARSRS
jgi:DNA-3-methyladenine glycosylase